MIRHAITARICLVLILFCGCSANRTESSSRYAVEQRVFGPVTEKPRVRVVCELRYYVVGSLVGPQLRVTEDKAGVTYSVSEPFRLLANADTNQLYDVRGFVLEVVSPRRYAGKVLTAHFDGVGGSGDPFKAFAFGHRYQVDVMPVSIGDNDFRLCY